MGMRAPSRAPDPPASDYACGCEGAYRVRARSMLACKDICSVSLLSLSHSQILPTGVHVLRYLGYHTQSERHRQSTHTYKPSFIHTNCGFTKQWLFRGRHNHGSGSLSLSRSFSRPRFSPTPCVSLLAFSRFLSHAHVCANCLSLYLRPALPLFAVSFLFASSTSQITLSCACLLHSS